VAESPGAGKMEVATTLSEILGDNLSIIDADVFRETFPGYNGSNSSDFQRGASWLVDHTFSSLIKKDYSFILDGTFAIGRASQNIERVLKHDYAVTIYFVYQDPQVAWRFTKIREAKQGRFVPKGRFINAYIKAYENVIAVKNKFDNQVIVNVVFKDFENAISDIATNVTNIALIVPDTYTKEQLEDLLDD